MIKRCRIEGLNEGNNEMTDGDRGLDIYIYISDLRSPQGHSGHVYCSDNDILFLSPVSNMMNGGGFSRLATKPQTRLTCIDFISPAALIIALPNFF